MHPQKTTYTAPNKKLTTIDKHFPQQELSATFGQFHDSCLISGHYQVFRTDNNYCMVSGHGALTADNTYAE